VQPVPGRFTAVVPVGPGRVEVERLTDLLDSLFHYEPDVASVVIVDDERDRISAATLTERSPRTCDVVVVPNPREPGRINRYGGLAAGVLTGFAAAFRNGGAAFVLKLDTDALVIAPFSQRVHAAFAADLTVGQVGAYELTCSGEQLVSGGQARLVRRRAQVVQLMPDRFGRRRPFVAASGPYAVLRRRIRQARRLGYRYGYHCQGGGFAVSGEALSRLDEAGDLADVDRWIPTDVPDDVLMTILVHAVGLRPLGLNGLGDPFGVHWRGLPFPPPELVDRGYGIVHSVKNDRDVSESDVRAYFRDRRRSAVPTA